MITRRVGRRILGRGGATDTHIMERVPSHGKIKTLFSYKIKVVTFE